MMFLHDQADLITTVYKTICREREAAEESLRSPVAPHSWAASLLAISMHILQPAGALNQVGYYSNQQEANALWREESCNTHETTQQDHPAHTYSCQGYRTSIARTHRYHDRHLYYNISALLGVFLLTAGGLGNIGSDFERSSAIMVGVVAAELRTADCLNGAVGATKAPAPAAMAKVAASSSFIVLCLLRKCNNERRRYELPMVFLTTRSRHKRSSCLSYLTPRRQTGPTHA